MDKGKLAALSRDGLIERAETLGVRRARFLTRPELVDEILLAESKVEGDKRGITRGFVGLARDLLARLVERGLHLPDAAERIRGSTPPPRPQGRASSIPTVTLAEIYASQGHAARAVETLRRLLTIEPEHDEARQMLAQFESLVAQATEVVEAEDGAADTAASLATAASAASAPAESVVPAVAATVEEPEPLTPRVASEPTSMLDDAPLPLRYDVDECVALPVDPRTVFVYWELREESLRRLAARVGGGGVVALRVAVLQPSWDGPTYSRFDCDVLANLGEYFLRDLPEGAVVRVAAGYRAPNGEFSPLAHSELFESAAARTPEGTAPSTELYSWTLEGLVPVQRSGREAAFLAEALHASNAPDLRQLAMRYGATALASWRERLPGGEGGFGSSEHLVGVGSSEHVGSFSLP